MCSGIGPDVDVASDMLYLDRTWAKGTGHILSQKKHTHVVQVFARKILLVWDSILFVGSAHVS